MAQNGLAQYESVIGLEVHAQLLTDSKMFCRCSTNFGDTPNSNTCPVCLGMPGALPVTNKGAIDFAIKAALGFNFHINEISQFARKNYFYPDLTKGYQITQFDKPIAEHGFVFIEKENERRKINITRLHLEEDAGKSIHDEGEHTKVDFNRCGVPLIEIVSEPEIKDPWEAECYLQKIRQILVYLNVCNGNLEQGSLRCDGNISIRPIGSEELFTKTEIKNLNSFSFLRKALQFEFERQVEVVENGGEVIHETRLWDQSANRTRTMRSKEEAHDYRYFPEPDLPLLNVSNDWISEVRKELPELPDEKIKRMIKEYSIPAYDATVLTSERELADYFERVAKRVGKGKAASNWVMGEVLRVVKELNITIDKFQVAPESLAALIKLVEKGEISGSTGKEVFSCMVSAPGKQPEDIIEERGLYQLSDDDDLLAIAIKVIQENPKPYGQYKDGKRQTFGFFVGQIMKVTQGRANPKTTQAILRKLLDASVLPKA